MPIGPLTVDQWTLDGAHVASFDTIAEASRCASIHAPNILSAISGKSKQSGGYRWTKRARFDDVTIALSPESMAANPSDVPQELNAI